jgi:hypothetical protein
VHIDGVFASALRAVKIQEGRIARVSGETRGVFTQVGNQAVDSHWRSSLDGRDFREASPAASDRNYSDPPDNSFTFNRLLQGPISMRPQPFLLDPQSSDEATPTFAGGGGRTWQLRSSQQQIHSPARPPTDPRSECIAEGDESQEEPQDSPFASTEQQNA